MTASVSKRLWSRVLERTPKLSKTLASMRHYKKIFLMKQVCSLFSLKQILGTERKHLSCHRLVVETDFV